jgi:low temperature requirement protein LtrA
MQAIAGNASRAHHGFRIIRIRFFMAANPNPKTQSLFRVRGAADGERVENIELFFDLVFVFAVTRLSHMLLGDLTATGALRVALLATAVWWVWIYTSWVTNWLAPERLPVRLCLFAMMGAGMLLSVAIPHAFDDYAMVFATSYVGMQVGRTLFFLWAARDGDAALRRAFQRILAWFLLSAVFWFGGATFQQVQAPAWTLAMALELLAPAVFYFVPGLGRSYTRDWNISGGHLAERCALFVIIALGESLLMTGTAFADHAWQADDTGPSAAVPLLASGSHGAASFAALASAALGSMLMWWIYFDTGAARAHHRIAHSEDPGSAGRVPYTYLHVPIVVGILASAVADELVLARDHHAQGTWLVLLGGPLVYLTGTALFKWVMNDRAAPPFSHVAGIALLLALAWPASAHALTTLQLGLATTGVLLVVAVWESLALRRPSRAR